MRELEFDDILPFVGEMGKFQVVIVTIMCFIMIPVTFPKMIMYFAALQPSWKCVNNSLVCISNATFPYENKSRCSMPRSEWIYDRPKQYSIITEFDICDEDWKIYLATSVMFIGYGIGAIATGWFADNYGRKNCLYPSSFIVMLVGLVSAFSPNLWMFIVFRFILGFFMPGTSVQLFIMASELVGPKFRPAVGMAVWFFFGLSLCTMGMTAYYVREWKMLYIFTTAPYAVLLLTWWIVPESSRWLRVQGRIPETLRILERVAYWNGKVLPSDVTLKKPPPIIQDRKASPLDLFRTRKETISTAVQGFAWLINGMVYYGLSLAVDDLGGNLYTNYILSSAVEFPATIIGMVGCNYLGRKKTVIISMIAGSLACITVAFIPTTSSWQTFRIFVGIFGKFCITLDFDSIYTWSVELFPTSTRANGMGFLQVTSRIGAATAPWVAKGLKVMHHTVPFYVMGGLALLAGGLLFKLPETKDRPTKETGDDYDDMKDKSELKQFIPIDS